MKHLIILNDPPYGTERSYNGLRMAHALVKRVLSAKGRVLMCGTCMDARGLAEDDMLEGAARSTMDELAETTLAADKVIVF